ELDILVLHRNDVVELEPKLNIDNLGDVIYKFDGIMYPHKLKQELTTYLLNNGVEFHYDTEVNGFETTGNKIKSAVPSKGNFHGDEVVATGGAASGKIGSKLKLR